MSVIVSLMGGLGFFLYGMKLMSEGLQKVAGSKMRSILEVFTKNRVIGLLVGIFFTALIQSSNATTVMVVSFVNSGLMKLAQAPGIILGANIGTTVTGQLIAFDLADIAPLFVIIGVLMVMFVKNNLTISRLGEVILGFGILFMGISGISGALNEAKEIPAVVNARITRTTRPGTAVCHHGGTDHLLYERYSHRRYLCRSTETARSSGRFYHLQMETPDPRLHLLRLIRSICILASL